MTIEKIYNTSSLMNIEKIYNTSSLMTIEKILNRPRSSRPEVFWKPATLLKKRL